MFVKEQRVADLDAWRVTSIIEDRNKESVRVILEDLQVEAVENPVVGVGLETLGRIGRIGRAVVRWAVLPGEVSQD